MNCINTFLWHHGFPHTFWDCSTIFRRFFVLWCWGMQWRFSDCFHKSCHLFFPFAVLVLVITRTMFGVFTERISIGIIPVLVYSYACSTRLAFAVNSKHPQTFGEPNIATHIACKQIPFDLAKKSDTRSDQRQALSNLRKPSQTLSMLLSLQWLAGRCLCQYVLTKPTLGIACNV